MINSIAQGQRDEDSSAPIKEIIGFRLTPNPQLQELLHSS
jgi:hypothetical protein